MNWVRYGFFVDKDKYLLDMYIVGCVITYVSMLLNSCVFCILFRRNLLSPSTILMQGLALADFLTAMLTYGFEPLFQLQYDCSFHSDDKAYLCYLPYPYCLIATHLLLLSLTFHTLSVIITTCLGIQKVVAIKFPIWTKVHLTNKTSTICCVVCFLFSIIISFPRHFVFDIVNYNSACSVNLEVSLLLEYSSFYYFLIQIVIIVFCCFIMLLCTVFITYKLVTNKFRTQKTKQRKRERRSVIMVVIILVVFLISEIPKVILYVWFFVEYSDADNGIKSFFLGDLLIRYEKGMAWMMALLNSGWGKLANANILFSFLMESMKFLNLIGCLSNFVIYVLMSSKLRIEICSFFKNPRNRST